MVSHTLMSHKGSYCSGLMHSQTQWVCRPESHFLLGEVSHCNKAGRGSQGRISTPGQDKWSLGFFQMLVPYYSSILHSARIQSSSALNSLQRMFCVSGLATDSPQFCAFTPQLHALWLSVEAFLICKRLAPIDKSKSNAKGILERWICRGSLCFAKVTRGCLSNECNPAYWFAYWFSETCLFAASEQDPLLTCCFISQFIIIVQQQPNTP